MESTEKIIGRLEAHHEYTQARLDVIEKKIDSFSNFKTKITAFASLIAFIVSAGITALIEKMK